MVGDRCVRWGFLYSEVTALWMTVFLRDLLLWVIPGHCV